MAKAFPRLTIKTKANGQPLAREAQIFLDGKEITRFVRAINVRMHAQAVNLVEIQVLANVDIEGLPANVTVYEVEPEPEEAEGEGDDG